METFRDRIRRETAENQVRAAFRPGDRVVATFANDPRGLAGDHGDVFVVSEEFRGEVVRCAGPTVLVNVDRIGVIGFAAHRVAREVPAWRGAEAWADEVHARHAE